MGMNQTNYKPDVITGILGGMSFPYQPFPPARKARMNTRGYLSFFHLFYYFCNKYPLLRAFDQFGHIEVFH